MTYHVPLGMSYTAANSVAAKIAALQVAERTYRAYPSAVTYLTYREAVYRSNPSAANLALYRSARTDAQAATAAATGVARRANIAPMRILREGSYARLSGLGAVLAVM
jgi:hypothetical protein